MGIWEPADLADYMAAEVAAATANYAVADALHLAAIAKLATSNIKTDKDYAAAAYATADADLALVVAQYAVADACWRSMHNEIPQDAEWPAAA